MRTVHSFLLAGIAAVAIAGSAFAAPANPAGHRMTVELPWGGVAHIEYVGNVPPKVSFDRAPLAVGMFAPDAFFAPDSAFPDLQRISVEMHRQMAAFEREAQGLISQSAMPDAKGLYETSAGNLPPGAESFSVVSTFTNNGACTRSVRITTSANGGKPNVIRHSSGNCAAERHGTAAPANSAPAVPSRAI